MDSTAIRHLLADLGIDDADASCVVISHDHDTAAISAEDLGIREICGLGDVTRVADLDGLDRYSLAIVVDQLEHMSKEGAIHLLARLRDRHAERVVDIRNVVAGDKAPNGQGSLQFLRGIEVGHIFQLGTVYSEPLQAGGEREAARRARRLTGTQRPSCTCRGHALRPPSCPEHFTRSCPTTAGDATAPASER